jgi:mxaL protein
VVETASKGLPCGSEAGLAIFAAHRTLVLFSPVEVCANFDALSEMLKKINWRMAWTARSEVSKGLFSAIEAAGQTRNDTRLVFITDGHEAPPLNNEILPPFSHTGDLAGFIGGIGGAEPSRIPHLDEEGNIVGYWSHGEVLQVDVHSLGRPTSGEGEAMVGVNMADVARRIMLGQEHLSSLREPHLQQLARQTGLDYVRVDSVSTFVENLHQKTYARYVPVQTSAGWVPASLAFACLVYCLIVVPWIHRFLLYRQSLQSPKSM